MIVRRAGLKGRNEDGREWLYYSDTGGLTQFGAYGEALQPGVPPNDKHWHEKEDEFLYLLAGELTVLEGDTEETLHPGDAACWPAGTAIHNQSSPSGPWRCSKKTSWPSRRSKARSRKRT